MQFLISVIDDKETPGPPSDMAAIGRFNDRLRAQGHWVYANGLADPATATVIDGRTDPAVFNDGPFQLSNEYLAGFWVIEAADADVARRIAAEGSNVCNRKVELRPFNAPINRT